MTHRDSRPTVLLLGITAILASMCLPQQALAEPLLWLIGDSTVRYGTSGATGWGEVVHNHFNLDEINVVNRAIAGRSSRSFYRDEYDSRVKNFTWGDINGWNPGDYLIMQFGHNDGPNPQTDPRGSLDGIGEETVQGTDKNGNPETVHTYGWYLRQMVNEAEAAGLIPIIASYVPRAENRDPTLSEYGLWAKQVAEQEDVGFINLYSMVTAQYADEAAAHPEDPNYIRNTYFGPDHTHTSLLGAELNADFVAQGIRGLDGDAGGLANYLLPAPEPSTALLLGAGVPMMLMRRRRAA